MTMRQVACLLKVINKSKWTDFYLSALSYRAWGGQNMPSLTEFLESSLDETSENKTEKFDPETDKFLELQALKRFEERKQGKNV